MKVHYVDVVQKLIKVHQDAMLREEDIDYIDLSAEEWNQLADKLNRETATCTFGSGRVLYACEYSETSTRQFNTQFMGMHVKLDRAVLYRR